MKRTIRESCPELIDMLKGMHSAASGVHLMLQAFRELSSVLDGFYLASESRGE